MLEELQKILNKNPIIYTKHASAIVENPNLVDNYYSYKPPLTCQLEKLKNIGKWCIMGL